MPKDVPKIDKITIKATDGLETAETSFDLTLTVKTGTSDEMKMNSLKLYPNPTTGLITLEFNRMPEKGVIIEVYNPLGQNILKAHVNSRTNLLNLSNYASGTYYIKTISKSGIHTEKIILR